MNLVGNMHLTHTNASKYNLYSLLNKDVNVHEYIICNEQEVRYLWGGFFVCFLESLTERFTGNLVVSRAGIMCWTGCKNRRVLL